MLGRRAPLASGGDSARSDEQFRKRLGAVFERRRSRRTCTPAFSKVPSGPRNRVATPVLGGNIMDSDRVDRGGGPHGRGGYCGRLVRQQAGRRIWDVGTVAAPDQSPSGPAARDDHRGNLHGRDGSSGAAPRRQARPARSAPEVRHVYDHSRHRMLCTGIGLPSAGAWILIAYREARAGDRIGREM